MLTGLRVRRKQVEHTGGVVLLGEDAFRRSKEEGFQAAAAASPLVFTHIAATRYMFYIIFGAAPGLHIA